MLADPARRAQTPTRALALPPPGILALLVALLALWALGYADALRLPFVGDDYFYLDEIRGASFLRLWTPGNLVSGYFRPWSREFHFWTLERVFGQESGLFHVANLALWLAIAALYFTLVRRLAGVRVAAIATAGLAALAAWGVLLVWASGSQDLWMLLFALVYLLACASRRGTWAPAPLALALLSKESAAMLPLVAVSLNILWERQAPVAALRRTWPSFLVVAVWALIHPSLGGRLWQATGTHFTPGPHPPLSWADSARFLAIVNLDRAFDPQGGWGVALLLGALTALVLAGFAAWGAAASEPDAPASGAARHRDPGRLVLFGAAWFVAGWLPMFMPSLGWHAYYGLLGALGAWLALAVGLASRPRLAVALVGAVALLRPASVRTYTDDWGTEAYQRNSATLAGTLRAEMMRLHPSIPRHSRIYLANLPGGIGLIAAPGDSPTLRSWYSDPTLEAGFFTDYRPRPADTGGRDYFFAADSGLRLIEFTRGAGPVPPSLARNPVWLLGENEIATIFSDHGEWAKALEGFLRLARIDSTTMDYAHNVGVCYARLGRTTEARSWLERAAVLRARAVSAPGGAGGR